MPSIAAVTMLAKLQSDVRKAENEVIHCLLANIDLKDIRVNQLNAYVSAELLHFILVTNSARAYSWLLLTLRSVLKSMSMVGVLQLMAHTISR